MKLSNVGLIVLAGAAALGALLVTLNLRQDRRTIALMAEAPEFAVTPVGVDFTRTIGAPYSRQIWDAVNSINDAVGDCNVLDLSVTPARIHIITSFDRAPCGGAKPAPSSKEASTYFCPDGSVDIVVDKAGSTQEAYLMVQHELAHGLGVPHGDRGLMLARPGGWDQVPFPLPTLEKWEARAIAKRYCHRGGPNAR